jgi:hypothetical protein
MCSTSCYKERVNFENTLYVCLSEVLLTYLMIRKWIKPKKIEEVGLQCSCPLGLINTF